MEQPTIFNQSAPKGELFERPSCSKPITASKLELRPGFIAMVQAKPFSGFDYENPYYHLREFEQLIVCITIEGVSQDTLRWKKERRIMGKCPRASRAHFSKKK